MANTKSAAKRARTNEVRRKKNVARRSDVKTSCKKIMEALVANNVQEAQTMLPEAVAKIARAKGKGLFKGNTARRKISRLAKRVAKAAKAAAGVTK